MLPACALATCLLRLLVLATCFAALLGAPPRCEAAELAAKNPRGLAPGDFEPNLPIVFLETKLPIGSEQRVVCTTKIVCPKAEEAHNTARLTGTIRLHGATSRGHPKQSFTVGLDEPARFLDMRRHAHWLLNAAYIDRSLMRHKLSFDLFRSLSTSDAPRHAVASRFVELYLNGSYHGTYLLMERVDRQQLALRGYRSNDLSHACIYKAVDHAAHFGEPGHSGYAQREPDPAARTFWEPLDAFNRFVSSASASEFFQTPNGIGSWLDLDNAIDFHLLVLLTSNNDGITKNFYVARNAQTPGQPKPRFFFVPWDYDGTFGRNWDATVVSPNAWLSNNLFDRLLDEPAHEPVFVESHSSPDRRLRGGSGRCRPAQRGALARRARPLSGSPQLSGRRAGDEIMDRCPAQVAGRGDWPDFETVAIENNEEPQRDSGTRPGVRGTSYL